MNKTWKQYSQQALMPLRQWPGSLWDYKYKKIFMVW